MTRKPDKITATIDPNPAATPGAADDVIYTLELPTHTVEGATIDEDTARELVLRVAAEHGVEADRVTFA
jgi:hypothetical protein